MSDYQKTIDHFDICIIGAGSGGLSVASGAAQLGRKVALIERAEMGGECLNTGCVPSKSLLHMAKSRASYKKAMDHVNDVIAQIAPHDSQARFENLGVTVIRAEASFVDTHIIETDKGDKITADFFVIASGSKSDTPPISGLDKNRVLTNETIFSNSQKPDHLLIIGGGPIGVEMAQAHIDLGCKVTLAESGRILSHDDKDAATVIRQSLQDKGVRVLEHTDIHQVTHGATHHDVTLTDDHGDQTTISASHILVATGRKVNLKALKPHCANLETTEKGFVVNHRLQTNHNHIYAIGDCVADAPKFTHVAGYHAGIVIRNICFRIPAKVDYKALPWVTYTDPELAHVGLNEHQGMEKYGAGKIRVLNVPLNDNDRARTDQVQDGFIKVIGKTNGKILGVTIVGAHAGELIAPWCLVISKGMKMKDMAGIILPYPTLSEISKAAAGAWYKDQLFSSTTRLIVKILSKLPKY